MPVELLRHVRPTNSSNRESILDTIDASNAMQVDVMAFRMAVLERVSRSLAPR